MPAGKATLMCRRSIQVLAILTAITLAAGCNALERQVGRPSPANNERIETRSAAEKFLPFGDPSNAVADPLNRDNFLMLKRSFALSYNDRRGTMNWVAWRTTIDDLGESLPRPQFAADTDLPLAFKKVSPLEYSGSGYDRGHMVPSADRFGDPLSNEETFLMTNVVPQTADLNQYVWEKLERYARGIVRRGSDVYTIAGVYGSKERIKDKLTVPTNCWKVIVVLPRGGTSANVDENTRIIAVDIPNENGIKGIFWQRFRTSVREIEQKSGLNLFSDLPQAMQDKLETRVDDN